MRDPVRVHVRDWALTVAAVVLAVFLVLVMWYANSLRNALADLGGAGGAATPDPVPTDVCVGEICPGN
jgi:hypothetical protein